MNLIKQAICKHRERIQILRKRRTKALVWLINILRIILLVKLRIVINRSK